MITDCTCLAVVVTVSHHQLAGTTTIVQGKEMGFKRGGRKRTQNPRRAPKSELGRPTAHSATPHSQGVLAITRTVIFD